MTQAEIVNLRMDSILCNTIYNTDISIIEAHPSLTTYVCMPSHMSYLNTSILSESFIVATKLAFQAKV